MKVYMLKDVEKVGMSGQIINVSDGYANNFLLPRKFALEVTGKNMSFLESKQQQVRVTAEAIASKAGMLAERIKTMHLTIKERVHDDGKLYGSVGADEIVQLLKDKDITVNRKQIEFEKSVRSVGEHKVIVRLSSKLRPAFTLKVVAKEGE
ncbi:MAG: 50S ribosomal protein L9 [Epsilonproteobacteria bacterium]|nr:50S ribosomal protein L9 [Campylobacterota bacterium]